MHTYVPTDMVRMAYEYLMQGTLGYGCHSDIENDEQGEEER